MQAMSEMYNRLIEVYQYTTGIIDRRFDGGRYDLDALAQNRSIRFTEFTRRTTRQFESAII